jgi:hypothetical protein
MAGKPGRSGGPRPGAGAPVRTWRLRNEDFLAVWEEDPDGQQIGAGQLAQVRVVSRTLLIITLHDGSQLKLVR